MSDDYLIVVFDSLITIYQYVMFVNDYLVYAAVIFILKESATETIFILE